MQRGNVYAVPTDPARHFRLALPTGALETLDLRMDEGLAAGRHCRSIVRHLTVVARQALAWEIVFFCRRGFELASPATSGFLCAWRFSASNGVQYGTSPLYYFQAENIDLPYYDADFEDRALPRDQQGGHLHLMLVNRSPTQKDAGDAGEILITAYMEPTYG